MAGSTPTSANSELRIHSSRPLEQESHHDEDEAHVLWVAYGSMGSGRGKGMRPLRLVEHIPGSSKQEQPSLMEKVIEWRVLSQKF